MEKLYKTVLMAMMALIMAVSFSACSDDDDNQPVNPSGTNIVGTWQKINNSTTDLSVTTLKFNSDGTGVYTYDDAKGVNSSTSKFEWILNEDSDHRLNLRIISKAYCEVAGSYSNISITKTMLEFGGSKYERK
ncbi:MAG: hypothetical protein NC406_05035 [Bacteroides sp.]|nr:hypothetical protein [Bacteroides sp.]MCM1095105.1 hypothetical protein [Terasakiella sp.]